MAKVNQGMTRCPSRPSANCLMSRQWFYFLLKLVTVEQQTEVVLAKTLKTTGRNKTMECINILQMFQVVQLQSGKLQFTCIHSFILENIVKCNVLLFSIFSLFLTSTSSEFKSLKPCSPCSCCVDNISKNDALKNNQAKTTLSANADCPVSNNGGQFCLVWLWLVRVLSIVWLQSLLSYILFIKSGEFREKVLWFLSVNNPNFVLLCIVIHNIDKLLVKIWN